MEQISTKDFVLYESKESKVKGGGEGFQALIDPKINVIRVYGMRGIGKTTLIEEVSKKVEKDGIFGRVVMAVVSQKPNLMSIQQRMLGLDFEDKDNMDLRAAKLRE
uniref:NB-ARC domain-containing protein n=1 Tax=Nelumbo nucifera TaxID=4432 RepID=A0A822YBU4_NELNU|nr:TPA_asm: hypothetical protein HUJ06_030449 [Nelumbo nucifera]